MAGNLWLANKRSSNFKTWIWVVWYWEKQKDPNSLIAALGFKDWSLSDYKGKWEKYGIT